MATQTRRTTRRSARFFRATGKTSIVIACCGLVLWSAVAAHASRAANGIPFNGLFVNGVPLNGMPFNGIPIQGMPFQGLPMNGMPFNGLYINGMPYNGMPMQGLPWQGMLQWVSP